MVEVSLRQLQVEGWGNVHSVFQRADVLEVKALSVLYGVLEKRSISLTKVENV